MAKNPASHEENNLQSTSSETQCPAVASDSCILNSGSTNSGLSLNTSNATATLNSGQNMKIKAQEYRKMLSLIDSELCQDDLRNLAFLSELKQAPKDGIEMFYKLENQGLLSDQKLMSLSGMLQTVGRVDLKLKLEEYQKKYVGSGDECSGACVSPFRALLLRLSEELSEAEVSRLRFLCGNVPKNKQIDRGIDLFTLLMQRKLLDWNNLDDLKDCLSEIDRNDLVQEVNDFIGTGGIERRDVSSPPVNTPMPELEENMQFGELESSFCAKQETTYCKHSNSGLQSTVESTELVQSTTLAPALNIQETGVSSQIPHGPGKGDIDHVANMLNMTVTLESAEQAEPLHSLSSLASSSVPYEGHLQSNMGFTGEFEEIVAPHKLPNEVSQAQVSANHEISSAAQATNYQGRPRYSMKSVPRGLCVIINNENFQTVCDDPNSTPLKPRKGTCLDKERLKTTFNKLGFEAVCDGLDDLTDKQMIASLKEISKRRDLVESDCFVCCILSHGGEGCVFGKNGRKVPLRSLTQLFTANNCPGLEGKPKLFFFVCCQGKLHQQAIPVDDGASGSLGSLEMDSPSCECIPNESDFLFGYATFPGHVSYRSKTEGTWYVQELTRHLDQYAQQEHLLDILTRVNQAVSHKVYRPKPEDSHLPPICVQTPAPQYTLRKDVWFLDSPNRL